MAATRTEFAFRAAACMESSTISPPFRTALVNAKSGLTSAFARSCDCLDLAIETLLGSMTLCSKRHAAGGSGRSGLYVPPSWGGRGGDAVLTLGFAERLERPVETPAFLTGVLRLRLAAL